MPSQSQMEVFFPLLLSVLPSHAGLSRVGCRWFVFGDWSHRAGCGKDSQGVEGRELGGSLYQPSALALSLQSHFSSAS